MPFLLLALVMCITAFPCLCQTTASKYELGTILAVKKHQNVPPGTDFATARYDVSIKVRNTVYVVLYTPPNGINRVEYSAGTDVLVSIGENELTFPSKLKFNETTKTPILRTETLPVQPTIDWSKAPGEYFRMKMQNLTEKLNLSEEQQAKIKPIAQQENGEVGSFAFTPTISRQEKLKRFEKLVRLSDEKMRPILSHTQWQMLQALRKDQKQELKNLTAQSKQ